MTDSIDDAFKSLISEGYYGPYVWITTSARIERIKKFNNAATTCIKCGKRVFNGDPDPIVRLDKGKIEVICNECSKKFNLFL